MWSCCPILGAPDLRLHVPVEEVEAAGPGALLELIVQGRQPPPRSASVDALGAPTADLGTGATPAKPRSAPLAQAGRPRRGQRRSLREGPLRAPAKRRLFVVTLVVEGPIHLRNTERPPGSLKLCADLPEPRAPSPSGGGAQNFCTLGAAKLCSTPHGITFARSPPPSGVL